MSEYHLHCFGESGNSYKAALMLQHSGLDWEPVSVDFFNGETRTDTYRREVNEMGEVPVLVHGEEKLTQSVVILQYLAEQSGRFGGNTARDKREILRWILFDNHKLTSYIATLRFLIRFLKSDDEAVKSFLLGRATAATGIVDKHLASQAFMVGDTPTIADFSLCGYLFYDGELGFDLAQYENISAWLGRIRELPGWTHPYDLMPSAMS